MPPLVVETQSLHIANLASDIFLYQQVFAFVVKYDMHFLRARSTDVRSKHDQVWRLAVHVLLVEVFAKQFHIAATTVNVLFMLHGELYD